MWLKSVVFITMLLADLVSSGLAQTGSPSDPPAGLIGNNQLSVDIGVLQGGVAYVHRVATRLSVGGRFGIAWESRNSLEAAARSAPEPFAGLHASAMGSIGSFSIGPTARFVVLSGSPGGLLYGIRSAVLLGD